MQLTVTTVLWILLLATLSANLHSKVTTTLTSKQLNFADGEISNNGHPARVLSKAETLSGVSNLQKTSTSARSKFDFNILTLHVYPPLNYFFPPFLLVSLDTLLRTSQATSTEGFMVDSSEWTEVLTLRYTPLEPSEEVKITVNTTTSAGSGLWVTVFRGLDLNLGREHDSVYSTQTSTTWTTRYVDTPGTSIPVLYRVLMRKSSDDVEDLEVISCVLNVGGTPAENPSVPNSVPCAAPTFTPSSVPTSSPSSRPSARPSSKPSSGPSSRPSSRPSAVPSAEPTLTPTAGPSMNPTRVPTTSHPSVVPTKTPIANPTAGPTTVAPTLNPSAGPTLFPSASPSLDPTAAPSAPPTLIPTTSPSAGPSFVPTEDPTAAPTAAPSNAPVADPSAGPTPLAYSSPPPTVLPTAEPTNPVPTAPPTLEPTFLPSVAPVPDPTASPSQEPSAQPVAEPTEIPSVPPSAAPVPDITAEPTETPSVFPTNAPVSVPSVDPSAAPSAAPQVDLTETPTVSPTVVVTDSPVADVTPEPSVHPSFAPVADPTLKPSSAPTSVLTVEPTVAPTDAPTAAPSESPSEVPTVLPSNAPVAEPSVPPTHKPSAKPTPEPSQSPSAKPSAAPTASPSANPTAAPSAVPTAKPSAVPTVQATDAAGIVIPGTPQLSSAVFSNDGTNVFVSFTSATNKAGLSSQFACSSVLSFTGASTASCTWTSTTAITVYPSSSTLSVGSAVAVVSNSGVRAACPAAYSPAVCALWSQVATTSVFIQAPPSPALPLVVISMASVLSGCSPLSIDLSASSGSGGRAWLAPTFTVISSEGDGSAVAAYLNRNYTFSGAISVPSALFPANGVYTIGVTLSTFLGASAAASQSVVVTKSRKKR